MNYQVFPLFTSVITLLLFFIALGLSFLGVTAFLSYLIVVGVAFPIIISMRLHRLNEIGVAFTLTDNTQWVTYIHGFPAQEQRSVLKNPCFFSEGRLQQFFIYSFGGKLCLQIACIAILARDYANQGNSIAVLFVLAYLLICVGRSARLLYLLAINRWQCESLTTEAGSVWYQGFLREGGKQQTLFKHLCLC